MQTFESWLSVFYSVDTHSHWRDKAMMGLLDTAKTFEQWSTIEGMSSQLLGAKKAVQKMAELAKTEVEWQRVQQAAQTYQLKELELLAQEKLKSY